MKRYWREHGTALAIGVIVAVALALALLVDALRS